LATYEIIISNLQEELKSILKVLKIPSLKTASNPKVDELKKSLKEKEEMIVIFKTKFEKKVIELREKHKSYIE
jgi:hypothetical protein